MYPKLRTHRSMPSKLNAVGPMKKIGCSLVLKNVRMSEMPLSLRDPNSFEMGLFPSLTSTSGAIVT